MYEVWKRKQIHENVQDHNSCQKVWKNDEDDIWMATTWSEEWTDKVRC